MVPTIGQFESIIDHQCQGLSLIALLPSEKVPDTFNSPEKVPDTFNSPSRWTLKLLADRMVQLEYIDQISYQTVRRTLKKTSSNLG